MIRQAGMVGSGVLAMLVGLTLTAGGDAHATTTASCRLDGSVLRITVDGINETTDQLLDATDGTIHMLPFDDPDVCLGVGATVDNTSAIDITDTTGVTLHIAELDDFTSSSGRVIPITYHSTDSEPEVSLEFDRPLTWNLAIGNAGINRNAGVDAQADIFIDSPNKPRLQINPLTGMLFRATAQGGAGTGAAFTGRLVYFTTDATRSVVTGGNGADGLFGSSANDTLNGGRGADDVEGGGGSDTLKGGGGNDTIVSDDGTKDRVVGGGGRDQATVDCGLDNVRSVEAATCG